MKLGFVRDLEVHLAATFGAASVNICADLCPSDFEGDVTINCFLLARQVRRSPLAIASEAGDFLSSHAEVVSASVVKAFVNVIVCSWAVCRDTVADIESLLGAVPVPEDMRQRVLIEFSAPNTNKPQHLGHVRNNTLGLATSSLLRRVGHTVVPINLVNDRGIHICKSMIAYQRWGNGETPASTGTKGDHLVGAYYVMFDREFRRQAAELKAADPGRGEQSDEDLFLETEIGRAAQEMLVAWEADDPEVRALWERMNGWVLAGFDETYKRMDVAFAQTYLESQTYTLGRDIIEKGLADGVFRRRDDGAIVIDLSAQKLGEKVVLRSDGTSVYVTQDIGTSLLKQKDYSPDRQLWIVGDEQLHHFRVLFAILEALGCPWADQLTHMAYGMVNLPSGRMKSREGSVVDADDLFDEMVALARKATLERTGPDAPADLEVRAEAIGMGALKFMLLKVSPKTTIMFDPEASIRFEGDTGPYVLYAYARICSMMRKAAQTPAPDGADVDWSVIDSTEARELALRCGLYPDVVRKAAENLDTSGLAGYLLDLAKSFSRFYRSCPVLSAPTQELRRARLALTEAVREVLRDGLGTLTLDVLESM